MIVTRSRLAAEDAGLPVRRVTVEEDDVPSAYFTTIDCKPIGLECK
jgi:hypothetical protein